MMDAASWPASSGLRPRAVNPALRAWRTHKKPPAGAGGGWFTRTYGIVPQFAWRASARAQSTRPSGPGAHAKSPRREPGEDGSREPAASCRSSLGGPPPARSQPGPPGLAHTQNAPGGSRGTPGGPPSRVPCDVGLNRSITYRRAAWMTGWFSCPESPGCHPGLVGAARPVPCVQPSAWARSAIRSAESSMPQARRIMLSGMRNAARSAGE